jgi:hypothetical protein
MHMTQKRNFPPGWTGELATVDLGSLANLPPGTYLDATLVVDHPDSPGLHGLCAILIRHENGQWETYANTGYCEPPLGGWEWDDAGDTGPFTDRPPLDILVWDLDTMAENAVDGNPEQADLHTTLAQEWEKASAHLQDAIERIGDAGQGD